MRVVVERICRVCRCVMPLQVRLVRAVIDHAGRNEIRQVLSTNVCVLGTIDENRTITSCYFFTNQW